MKWSFLILLLIVSLGFSMQRPDLSDKFIPTFAVKYCGVSGLSDSITAKFDLLVTTPAHYAIWGKNNKNSWQNLKTLNTDMVVVLYQMGPGEYNTAEWGRIKDGWEWMKANHGATTGVNRWTGSGLKYSYLSNSSFPNERIMNLGHADWQKYWYEGIYADWWGGADSARFTGADGIFSDNTSYEVVWKGLWYDENHVRDTAYLDHPADYYTNGAYNDTKWKNDMKAFFSSAIPGLASKPKQPILVPNFGYMGSKPAYWTDLDSLAFPPFAAMEEGGFCNPWPKAYSAWDWENLVNSMKSLKNVAVLMTQHGAITSPAGVASMDVVKDSGNLGAGTSGWDALWFSMISFLLALNSQKSNGYFSFVAGDYCSYYWLDEFDPQYIHLGAPLADYYVQNGVAFREYQDGWVVVNKTHQQNKTNIAVPFGRARVITHANFKNADVAPLVTSFDLKYYRGIILLKEGRKLGNADNPTTGVSQAREGLALSPGISVQYSGGLIKYYLNRRAPALLQILEIKGRVVATLLNGMREPGAYSIAWNGRDAGGRALGSGVYLCRFSVGSASAQAKITLLR